MGTSAAVRLIEGVRLIQVSLYSFSVFVVVFVVVDIFFFDQIGKCSPTNPHFSVQKLRPVYMEIRDTRKVR